MAALGTYVRMSPDLFDGLIIEVAGIAGEVSANLVGVLQALKERIGEGKLATLPQLKLPSLLTSAMDRIQPDVVIGSLLIVHMLLELDDVAVGDGLSVGR